MSSEIETVLLPAFEHADVFRDDLDALEHALDLFIAQYLQALMRAKTPLESQRAWSAYFNYLVAPATRRKQFQLDKSEADLVISDIQEIIQGLSNLD
jgi:hypothetical protein